MSLASHCLPSSQSLSNPAYEGVYNATAPKPVKMSELCSALGEWVALLWRRKGHGGWRPGRSTRLGMGLKVAGWKPPSALSLVPERMLGEPLLLRTSGRQLGPAHLSATTPALSPGNILGRPSWLPVPEFALMTLLGEGASVVLDVSAVGGGRGGAGGRKGAVRLWKGPVKGVRNCGRGRHGSR